MVWLRSAKILRIGSSYCAVLGQKQVGVLFLPVAAYSTQRTMARAKSIER